MKGKVYAILLVLVLGISCSNTANKSEDGGAVLKSKVEKLPSDKYVRKLAFASGGVMSIFYDRIERTGDTVEVIRYSEYFIEGRKMIFAFEDNALVEVEDDGANPFFANKEPIKVVLPDYEKENAEANPLLYLPGEYSVEKYSKHLYKDSSTYGMGEVEYDCIVYDYYKMKNDNSGDSIVYSYAMFNDEIGFCYQIIPEPLGGDIEITLEKILTFEEFEQLKKEADSKREKESD